MKLSPWVLLLGGLFLFGGSSSPKPGGGSKPKPGRKLKPGDRLLLIGDSQSVAENPNSPGQLLAKLANQVGFKARVLAVGGKTAAYFTHGEGLRLLSGELAQRPAAVLVFMGTNELANVALSGVGSSKGQIKGHQALRELILKAGARALFAGPPNFSDNVYSKDKHGNKQGEPLVTAMPELVPRLKSVYGEDNFVDGRPATPMPHTEIHFGKKQAQEFAQNLAQLMVAKWG